MTPDKIEQMNADFEAEARATLLKTLREIDTNGVKPGERGKCVRVLLQHRMRDAACHPVDGKTHRINTAWRAELIADELIPEWPHFSGSMSCPIPGLPGETPQRAMMESTPRTMWHLSFAEGNMRYDLVRFLRNALEGDGND